MRRKRVPKSFEPPGRPPASNRFGMRVCLILLALVGAGINLMAQQEFSVQNDAQILQALREAAAAQRLDARSIKTFHQFRFTDRQPESGIRFRYHMTDDSGRAEKAIHYDHGSGVAIGDIDGDGLPDLYFGNQIGGNELWRNLGGGRFTNITEQAGVRVPDRVTVGVAFADLDNDGDPDLVVSTVRDGNVLFENLGNGRFRDRTADVGWNTHWHSSGIVILDFNRDSRPDILITSVGRYTSDVRNGGYWVGLTNAFSGHLFPERSEPCLLYRNDGNWKFTDVAQETGLKDAGWSGDATACDINEDGWPDLYVLNMQGDDHLFVNREGKHWEDQTSRYFPKTPWGAMGVAVFDFNLDGRFDYLVTDMHSDMTSGQSKLRMGFNGQIERSKSEAWCSATWTDQFLQGAANNIFGNALYVNQGDGRFEERSDALGVETYWPWGVSIGDVNADGWEDIMVTAGMGYPFTYAVNALLLNEAGARFKRAEFILGIEPRRDQRVSQECFVLDLDGADQKHPLAANRKGKLTVRSSLSTRAAGFVDLDNDGDLDGVTNEFDDFPQVLMSDLTERRPVHFLKLQLRGKESNRQGLGAVVRVKAGTQEFSRYVSGKSGYLSQSDLPLYFGLGDHESVDEVRIVWPSGVTQIIREGLPRNGLKIVEEPGR